MESTARRRWPRRSTATSFEASSRRGHAVLIAPHGDGHTAARGLPVREVLQKRPDSIAVHVAGQPLHLLQRQAQDTLIGDSVGPDLENPVEECALQSLIMPRELLFHLLAG